MMESSAHSNSRLAFLSRRLRAALRGRRLFPGADSTRPSIRKWRQRLVLFPVLTLTAGSVWAGPPYVTDDPEPTDTGHYEIYTFDSGTLTDGGRMTSAGIDFNYGAAEDLQLTAVVPYVTSSAMGGVNTAGVGDVELAAKFKVLHQEQWGWDLAVFPRVLLPALSHGADEDHPSLWLPVWVEKDWDGWSTFGGAGYTLNQGAGYRNGSNISWAVTHDVAPDLHVGLELYHTASTLRTEPPATGMNVGAVYDLNPHMHLMSAIGPGLQNAATTGRLSWYGAILFTF